MKELLVREGYDTKVAHNGLEALRHISTVQPDLVISDIQMPVMDGFSLFAILEERYPGVKHIMMTSYNIDQYITHIRRHNIGNILVKGFDFNLVEVANYIRVILTGEIFGLGRYINCRSPSTLFVRSYSEAKDAYQHILGSFPQNRGLFLELAIDELISNAIFHGALQLSHISREYWSEEALIPKESAIQVCWGADDEKLGISVEDPKGSLKKIDVLRWLDSHCRSDNGDEHGRGFLLVRRLLDRLIINIDPGRRTECIIIQFLNKDGGSFNKPLLIHEL